MTDRVDLDRVDALCEQATPGPIVMERYDHGGGRAFVAGDDRNRRALVADFYHTGDREFFFNCITLVPAMASELRAARSRVLDLESVITAAAEFRDAGEEGEWGEGTVIFRMAEDNDRLSAELRAARARIAELKAIVARTDWPPVVPEAVTDRRTFERRSANHNPNHAPDGPPPVSQIRPIPAPSAGAPGREMHDRYEAAAVASGWETQEKSRKPWEDVPEANKQTMRAAVAPIADEIARLRALVPDNLRDDASQTAPIVLRFASAMEAKLEQNRHKGDANGWRRDSLYDLLGRLGDETDELRKELGSIVGFKTTARIPLAQAEAADVANFAMMMWDVLGQTDLPSPPEAGDEGDTQ